MITKEFKIVQQTRQCTYLSNKGCGFFPIRCCNGQVKYAGPADGSGYMGCFLYFGTHGSGANSEGYSFTSDDVDFSGITDEVYDFSDISGVSYSIVGVSFGGQNDKMYTTYRYQLNNNSANQVIVRKYFIRTRAYLFGSSGVSSASPSQYYFLSLVQDLPTPVVINAGETAIIDVTIETEIPE